MKLTKNIGRRAAIGMISAAAMLASGMALAQDTPTDSILGPVMGDMSIGNPDAAITVVEYASFTCPHCATFHHEVYPELKANYIDTGKINFIFRPVYFDGPGLWADMVARCGGEDRFFIVAGLLFDRQAEWSRADSAAGVAQGLQSIGRQAGMDDATIDACLQNNDAAKELVAAFQENASRDGIEGTPTFMIDGELNSNMSYASFAQILDEKLGE